MNRQEAERCLGHRVRAWTAANGVYVGVLEAVTGSPWRGRVRITGILEPAQHFERTGLCRRGFRPGEVIEVGHSSIGFAPNPGSTSYVEVVERELGRREADLARFPESPNAWVHRETINALQLVKEAELRRLRTGEWFLEEVFA